MSLRTRLQLAAKAAFGSYPEEAAGNAFSLLSGQKHRAPLIGTREILQGYSTMPWLRAASGKVSDAVGGIEWELYAESRQRVPRAGVHGTEQRVGPRRDLKMLPPRMRRRALRVAKQNQEYRPIENHPLLDLLSFGSPLMPGQSMIKITQVHIDLVGEAFWLMDRDGLASPSALYPLAPYWIKRLPTRSHPFYLLDLDGDVKPVPVTEIIRFCDPDPANPFGRGSGLGKSLADELQTDEFAAKLTKMRFVNQGRADLVVSADDLKPSEVERLEEEWTQRHTGFWNAFKPFFAGRKLEVQVVNQSFVDLQVMELRKHERDTIIQVWSVPPEILGITENSNRANITMADFIFSAWVVDPRMDFMRRTLQSQLAPLFDERLYLDYRSPIDEDRDFQREVMHEAPYAFTDDEWREVAGFEPLPNDAGKVRRVPLNLVTEDMNGIPQVPPGRSVMVDRQPSLAGLIGTSDDDEAVDLEVVN